MCEFLQRLTVFFVRTRLQQAYSFGLDRMRQILCWGF